MVLWQAQCVLLVINYPLLYFWGIKLENSNIVRSGACNSCPPAAGTLLAACHQMDTSAWRLGDVSPTCFSLDLQSSHPWHWNVWNNIWPQIPEEETNSLSQWRAGAGGERWGLLRCLRPGQGQRPGDRRHWCAVKTGGSPLHSFLALLKASFGFSAEHSTSRKAVMSRKSEISVVFFLCT